MFTNTYLLFDGNCEAAMTFYAKVLGAKIEAMMRYEGSPMEKHFPVEDRKRIMHCSIAADGIKLMASDAPRELYTKPQGFRVTVNLNDTAKAEQIFAELSQGGDVRMALQKTFWATLYGETIDRFGTPWMINCHSEG